MAGYKLISADSHIVEPPDMYAERIDPKFRDRAPKMERRKTSAGREYDAWVIDGMQVGTLGADLHAVDDPGVVFSAGRSLAALHLRRPVPELGVDALGIHVRRFNDMGIRRNQLVPRHHTPPPLVAATCSLAPISALEQSIPPSARSRRSVISATHPALLTGRHRASALDRVPLFIATRGHARMVRLRPRHPGQSAARLRPLSVAFLSALPAAAVHRLAESFRRLVRSTRLGHGSDVRDRCTAADPDGVPRRPLRRPPVPRRWHLANDLVDGSDGIFQQPTGRSSRWRCFRVSATRSSIRRITRF